MLKLFEKNKIACGVRWCIAEIADTAEGLERGPYLAKGAKVMLTKNLYQQVGLVNGIRGEVVELVYADDAPPP